MDLRPGDWVGFKHDILGGALVAEVKKTDDRGVFLYSETLFREPEFMYFVLWEKIKTPF